MIGERIRHARKAAALTLGELAERLGEVGESITKAGISKYELGKSTPKASFLQSLGDALGLPPQYFLQETQARITWRLFRKKSKLSLSKQDSIKARVTDIVESQIWLEKTVCQLVDIDIPPRRVAKGFDDVEKAATKCREHWGLGEFPVERLTSLLESNGFIVVPIPDVEVKFDGLSGWIGSEEGESPRPLIVINTAVSADRVRYNLAHELGHLIVGDESIPEDDEEKFAHRFAAAFLAPKKAAYRELGSRRRNLLLDELCLLKKKYGFSMQGWIRRAFDLGIIKKSCYQALFREFSMRGWRKEEPVAYDGYELPTRYQQLSLRAQAEDIIITEGRVRLVMPEDIRNDSTISKARAYIEMQEDTRNALLEKIAEKAAAAVYIDDVLEFESLGVDDFYNYADEG